MKIKIMAIASAVALVLGLSLGASAEELRSLRGDAVNQPDKVPDVYRVEEGNRLPRSYRQQPPLVPHTVDKYEIDLRVNQCLRCHEWPYSDQERAPKISDAHYMDRNGVRQDHVNGNRYICTQCHVPQADTKPLVKNRFQPAPPAQ